MSSQKSTATLDKIVALCKRRGFVFQSAEIYGGLNGVYDMGPLGHTLRQNIKNSWIDSLNKTGLEILFMDGALLAPEAVWKASGHVENFNDPMVDCLTCKHRYRADDPDFDINKACPHCGNKNWTEARQFNMMFKTQVGAAEGAGSVAYLRPETAQSIFINFKNIISSYRVKIPFGIAQIGKAFRNEITPKQFLFRMREFEQMEMEWFCKEETALEFFKFWCETRKNYYSSIGIDPEKIKLRSHTKEELSHYSSATSDVEYQFPFGLKELEGIAYRGNFDLSQHSKFSGKDLGVYDEETKQSYVPHVVECSVGVDRLFLTVLFDAYCEDEVDGETRVVLKLHPRLAPIKAAFMPLTKELGPQFSKIYETVKKLGYSVTYDQTGSIGKRYRRQDEIGTVFCFTYDFDSEKDNSVTVRHRDTTKQERIKISDIESYLKQNL